MLRVLEDSKLKDLFLEIQDKLCWIAESLEKKPCVPYPLIKRAINLINQLENRKHNYGSYDECRDEKRQRLIAIVSHILPSLSVVRDMLREVDSLNHVSRQ